MSENLSLDETIAKLKAEAQEALKNVISDNKQRFEASLVSRQSHLVEKLNPNLIKFNVGGFKFVTTLETLSNIKDTKLHKMATGRHPISLDKKNRIFIDRNGQYFGHVLDCLRKGKVELPSDSFLSSRVQREFEFFGLVSVASSSSNSSNKIEETKVNSSPAKLPTAAPGLFGAKPAATSSSLFGNKTLAPGLGQTIKMAAPPMPFVMHQPAGLFGSKPVATGPELFAKAMSKPVSVAKTPTITAKQELDFGERQWKFSPEDDSGGSCTLDKCTIESSNGDYQTIGDTLLTSGTHQWRFFAEEALPAVQGKKGPFAEGIVTFGVLTKETWKKVKKNRTYEMICGFNTIGETFISDIGKKKKELKVDGPDYIKEFGCKNQEFTLTFNTQTGVLKLAVKGHAKSHMLKINESVGKEYYPYFHIENAVVQLLESRELAENEQAVGMEFVLEKDEMISGDDEEESREDDDEDYEDVEDEEF